MQRYKVDSENKEAFKTVASFYLYPQSLSKGEGATAFQFVFLF
jgi:hypothetical protein